MKRVILFSITIFSAIALLGFVRHLEAPDAKYPPTALGVGEAFLKAYAKGDYEKAKTYTSKDSEMAMDLLIEQRKKSKAVKSKITVGAITEMGKKAVLTYRENGKANTLDLQIEDGLWRVIFTKDQSVEQRDLMQRYEKAAPKTKKVKCKSPEKAGMAFLDAYAAGDYATAKSYATKDSEAALDMLGSLEKDLGKVKKAIIYDSVSIIGDKAVLSYSEEGVPKTLDLVKVDGYWLVAFVKSSYNDIYEVDSTDGENLEDK